MLDELESPACDGGRCENSRDVVEANANPESDEFLNENGFPVYFNKAG